MSDVQFTEEQYAPAPRQASAISGLVSVVMAWGLAKDEREAEKVLLIIAGIAAVIGVAVWWISTPHVQPMSKQEAIRVYQEAHPGQPLPEGFR